MISNAGSQESVVVLVGVLAQEAQTITGFLRASGTGPFSTARVVQLGKDNLSLTLKEALSLEGHADGNEMYNTGSC